MTAAAGAEAAATNIINTIRGRARIDYKSAKDDIIVVSLGPQSGAGQLPMGMTVGGFMTRNIKSGDLFTNKMWTTLNNPKPVDP